MKSICRLINIWLVNPRFYSITVHKNSKKKTRNASFLANHAGWTYNWVGLTKGLRFEPLDGAQISAA